MRSRTIAKPKAGWKPNLHPNGFWISVLKVFKNGARLRLHYWPSGTKKLETPHDHRSWFISVPLWGIFEERRFRQVPGDDKQVLQCSATASGGNGKPHTKPVGVGSVEQIGRWFRFPLLPYLCRVGEIHSYLPWTPGPALSLVLFGPPQVTPRAWVEPPLP